VDLLQLMCSTALPTLVASATNVTSFIHTQHQPAPSINITALNSKASTTASHSIVEQICSINERGKEAVILRPQQLGWDTRVLMSWSVVHT